jgi:hypothetical protein
MKILPGTGRWREATEGSQMPASAFLSRTWDPTTTSWSPSPFRGGFTLEQFQ